MSVFRRATQSSHLGPEIEIATSTVNSSDVPSRRFIFIDGIRGLAALSVVVFHLGPVGQFRRELLAGVGAPAFAVLSLGYLGVAVFFVLSGFVIAYSVRNAVVTVRYYAKFILRRSLRLDPPYWTAIALAVVLGAVGNRVHPASRVSLPGIRSLLAHLTYTQELFHIREINGVFWTLCLEVQFYLVFLLLVGVVQRFRSRESLPGIGVGIVGLLIFGTLAAISLIVRAGVISTLPGLFVGPWCNFFLGVLVCWALADRRVILWLIIYSFAFAAAVAVSHAIGNADSAVAWSVAAAITAIVIFLAGKSNGLTSWLSQRWIQFTGRISYSLYLIHGPVGNMVISVGTRIHLPNAAAAVAWIILSIAVSVLAAYAMYLGIERPALRLAHHIGISNNSAAR